MPQLQHVVVFGDSLSDIGIKWAHGMGWVADNFLGKITVNQSGRFSDCRNWTDFLFEEAAGRSLVQGDAKTTIAASKVHQKLSSDSLVRIGPERVQLPGGRRGAVSSPVMPGTNFYFANYAEGGATGDKPANVAGKIGLNTFKDQVKKFRSHYAALNVPGPTLFLVWFGANDLYTAKAHRSAMSGVARTVADTRRDELEAIVGKPNAHFVFMNMGRPEASTRYQEMEHKGNVLSAGLGSLGKYSPTEKLGKESYVIAQRKKKGEDMLKELRKLREGADLFNEKMVKLTKGNGDALVDIASVVCPDTIGTVLGELNLLEGSQPDQEKNPWYKPGLKKQWVDVSNYEQLGSKHVTCSDKAHPTDRVYKLIWKQIRATLLLKDYKFGLFNK